MRVCYRGPIAAFDAAFDAGYQIRKSQGIAPLREKSFTARKNKNVAQEKNPPTRIGLNLRLSLRLRLRLLIMLRLRLRLRLRVRLGVMLRRG